MCHNRPCYKAPQGQVFNQAMAREMAQEEDLVFLCGHYEGIDERVLEEIVTDYVSIGDYVLTGGELPARKPINRQVEGGIHFAGLMLLMALMVFVMYNDIVKLI